jgi:hypothetical protein
VATTRTVVTVVAACAIAVAGCGGSSSKSSSSSKSGSGQGEFLGKGSGEDASAGSVPDYQPSGQLIADDGFRPDKGGFHFENYTNDKGPQGTPPQNLTPSRLQEIFGDQVCASGTGDSCQLTPPAQQWMDGINKSMAGGHCEGFSVTALRLFKGSLKPDPFGGGDTFGLSEGSAELQSQIAAGYVTQGFQSVISNQVHGTPTQVLDKLTEALKSKGEYYTVGIYQPDGSGGRKSGHAVTPYAVEDLGGGKQNVLIYDNNYPGKTRAIQFDRNADTWQYDAQTNPNNPAEQYRGDAQTNTIELDPLSPGEGQQPCPFCNGQGGESGAGKGSVLASDKQYNEITLEGDVTNHAHLLLTDEDGNKTGYDNGKLVQDIPGSQVMAPHQDRDWEGSPEPSYRVPTGKKVTVTIDGSRLQREDTETVTFVGPGDDTGVQDIKMGPGQKDELTFFGDGSGFDFTTDPNQSDTPIMELGFTSGSGDYGFAVTSLDLEGSSKIDLHLDQEHGQLHVDTTGTKGNGTYALSVVRESGEGTQKFKHDHLALAGGELASLDYKAFTRQGEPIKLEISQAGQTRSEELSPDGG